MAHTRTRMDAPLKPPLDKTLMDIITVLEELTDTLKPPRDTTVMDITTVLEELAMEVGEAQDVRTRPGLNSSSMSGRSTSITTSCSTTKSPYPASTASLEATAATGGARRLAAT